MSYLSLFSNVPCTKIGHYIEQSVNFLTSTRMTSKIQSLNCRYFSSLVINYLNDLSRMLKQYRKLTVSIVSSKSCGFSWGGAGRGDRTSISLFWRSYFFKSVQKCFYNWSCSFYKLENCKWCAKVVDRALVKAMTVEPGANSDRDTGGEDMHGRTHTLTPEQTALVG